MAGSNGDDTEVISGTTIDLGKHGVYLCASMYSPIRLDNRNSSVLAGSVYSVCLDILLFRSIGLEKAVLRIIRPRNLNQSICTEYCF